MSACRFVFSAVLAGALVFPALAQSPTPLPPLRGPGNRNPQTTPPKRERREPCWESVGISKAAMEQRHAINEQARQEIETVCANPSLTIQQKHEQIRSIREREKQQVEAIISPQQREALKACQESRGHGGHGGGGGGGGMGPCGEMPSTRGTTPPRRGTTPPVERDDD